MFVNWIPPQEIEEGDTDYFILTADGKKAVGKKSRHGWWVSGIIQPESYIDKVMTGVVVCQENRRSR